MPELYIGKIYGFCFLIYVFTIKIKKIVLLFWQIIGVYFIKLFNVLIFLNVFTIKTLLDYLVINPYWIKCQIIVRVLIGI